MTQPPQSPEPGSTEPRGEPRAAKPARPRRPPPPEISAEAPSLPRWLRASGEGEPAFAAGAALAWLDPIARSEAAPGTLWRRRLALSAAESLVRLDGLRADQASLRDHWVLRRGEDDPGPAARIYGGCRWLTSPAAMRGADWAARLPEAFALAPTPALTGTLQQIAQGFAQRGRPVEEAATAAASLIALGAAHRGLALALADVVLARALGWPAAVPLLATHLKRADLRLADQSADWTAACARAIFRAAIEAADLHADLRRRALRLVAASVKLRGRDAGAGVAALLSEDALSAVAGALAGPGAKASDRGARRFFDSLLAAGAVRELTGRSSFRLYGL